jgi:DNA-binding CsgD family transcriptional regulator/tetratricopeptide (TPR) repeat protein
VYTQLTYTLIQQSCALCWIVEDDEVTFTMIRSPVLERGPEIARIQRVLADAATGSGSLLVIEGPSGIGKTRLLEEADHLAVERGMTVLRTRGGELEHQHAWGTVLDLFETRLLRAEDGEYLGLPSGRAALAAPLLSRSGDVAARLDASKEFPIIHGLYWAVVNLADDRPILLVVDDAQWADEQSMRFLIYLAQRLDDLPLFMLVGMRTGLTEHIPDLVHRLAMAASAGSLRPAELSPTATTQYLSAVGLPTFGADFARTAWEVTQGNPFLLQELAETIRQAVRSGNVTEVMDLARLRDFAPHSVTRNVIVRLSALGEDAVHIARACAVLGDDIPLSRAAALSGMSSEAAAPWVERLVDVGFLTGVDPISFMHPMIRSAVKWGTPPGERSRLRARAAEVLHAEGASPDEVAPLLISGTPVGAGWAREVLQQAARSSARRGAPQTAVHYLRRALELSSSGERTPSVLIDLGLAEAAAGDTTSISHIEEALGLIDNPGDEGRALYSLGHTLHRYGRHLEALDVYARGQRRFAERDPVLAVRFDSARIAAAWYCAGDPTATLGAEVRARLERSAGALHTDDQPDASARLLLAVAGGLQITHGGSAQKAAELARKALGTAMGAIDDPSIGIGVNIALLTLVSSGEFAETRSAADEVLAIARARGDLLAFADASAIRAYAAYAEGLISEAMADAQAAVEGTEHGWGLMVPIPHAILSHCLIERGELDAAGTLLESVAPKVAARRPTALTAYFYWARGRWHNARIDCRRACEDFRTCEQLMTSAGLRSSPVFSWRLPAALAASAAGERDQAMRLIDEHLVLGRQFGLEGHVGAALHARAFIENGPPTLPILEYAIAHLEKGELKLELARALVTYGTRLRDAGRRVQSREPLRRALGLAHHCGATVLEGRAREELVAFGARPRRAVSDGAGSLTPTERRVADLAVKRLSNREIAETLFVTTSTIEWHLRHVYTKLGIKSRTEIAPELAASSCRPNSDYQDERPVRRG